MSAGVEKDDQAGMRVRRLLSCISFQFSGYLPLLTMVSMSVGMRIAAAVDPGRMDSQKQAGWSSGEKQGQKGAGTWSVLAEEYYSPAEFVKEASDWPSIASAVILGLCCRWGIGRRILKRNLAETSPVAE